MTILQPLPNAVFRSPHIPVEFSLPELPLSGSVTLCVGSPSLLPVCFNLSAAYERVAVNLSLLLNASNPSVALVSDAVYLLSIQYQDAFANPVAQTVTRFIYGTLWFF
jgi:hypothetical protein